MQADLPSRLPLVCVACRGPQRQVQVLELATILRREGDDVRDGILACARCQRRYPIIDSIPVIVRDASAWLARYSTGLVDPELPAEIMAVLVEPGPDDAVLARSCEVSSVHLDAHWGDRATPPVPHTAALFERVRARASARVETAIEVGCSYGRGLAELARGAALTVGVDLSLESLRSARRLLAGDEVPHLRRMAGRHYIAAPIQGERAVGPVELVCADALELPLLPRRFDRVLALNMLEVVPDPVRLLATLVELCAPGGEVLGASAYLWQSAFMPDSKRIGTVDPGADVLRMLTWERGLELEDEADVETTLRRDARQGSSFRLHWLRLRRPRS